MSLLLCYCIYMTMFQVVKLLMAASNGDKRALERSYLSGMDMNIGDYDRRTALHLACSEGHMSSIRFLVEVCSVDINIKDRWGCTPLEEAKKNNNATVIKYLMKHYLGKYGPLDNDIIEENLEEVEEEMEKEGNEEVGVITTMLMNNTLGKDIAQGKGPFRKISV